LPTCSMVGRAVRHLCRPVRAGRCAAIKQRFHFAATDVVDWLQSQNERERAVLPAVCGVAARRRQGLRGASSSPLDVHDSVCPRRQAGPQVPLVHAKMLSKAGCATGAIHDATPQRREQRDTLPLLTYFGRRTTDADCIRRVSAELARWQGRPHDSSSNESVTCSSIR